MDTANDYPGSAAPRRNIHCWPAALVDKWLAVLIHDRRAGNNRPQNDIASPHITQESTKLSVRQIFLAERFKCFIEKLPYRLRRAGIRIPLSAAFLGGALLLLV